MNQANQDQNHTPRVSIGLPVFNGGQHIRETIESLLVQTFSDFELIISDNASTDNTEIICLKYAATDQRIRYFRHTDNLGAAANFKFVFDKARGEYFTWTGCDDTRSTNFLEVNLNFMIENTGYVASTCPNGFDDRSLEDQTLVVFALDGNMFERFIQFFDYCWVSHGAFYSLIRSDVLQRCSVLGRSFIAADWAIILYLASKGKVNRTTDGHAIFGASGVSRSADAYKAFRNKPIELIVPLYELTRYTIELIDIFTLRQKLKILFILIKMNLLTVIGQFRLWFTRKFHKQAID